MLLRFAIGPDVERQKVKIPTRPGNRCALPVPSGFAARRLWPPALIFAVSFGVYLSTLCPTVFVEGAGENIVCVWTLGVPHPPGFPLFCLLGKLFTLLVPVGSIAYRINLFAALTGSIAAAGLYLLLTANGLRRLAAAAAALTFAFSATFWSQCTIAEVYPLSLALIIVQIGLLLRWRQGLIFQSPGSPHSQKTPGTRKDTKLKKSLQSGRGMQRQDRPLLWLALAFGLGLTVHYNHILLLPAYLYFIFIHDRMVFTRVRLLLKALLLSLLGFSVHLYAPVASRANPPIDWGNPENLQNWWRYLTAAQYRGRMFHLPVREVIGNLGDFLANVPVEFRLLGLAAAVLGAIVLFRRDRSLFWFTTVVIILFVAWSINYDIPWEIKVYYLPALLMMAIWIGFGLDRLTAYLSANAVRVKFIPLLLSAPLLALLFNFSTNDLSRQSFVLDHALDILDTVQPPARVILPSTNPTFALIYLKQTTDKADRVELWSRIGSAITSVEEAVQASPDRQSTPTPRFVAQSLAGGYSVYSIERKPDDLLAGFTQVPWGCLYRLVPSGEKEKWLGQAPDPLSRPYRFRVDRQKFAYGKEQKMITCHYLLLRADYAWETGDLAAADRLYERVRVVGEGLPSIPGEIGLRYVGQGRSDLAVNIYEQALAARDDAFLRNRLGAIYGRQNRLEEAKEQFEYALKLKTDLAEAHANLASVYGRQGEIEKAVAKLKIALQYDPNNLRALTNLARVYANMGRHAEARKLLRKAHEINPAQKAITELTHRLQN